MITSKSCAVTGLAAKPQDSFCLGDGWDGGSGKFACNPGPRSRPQPLRLACGIERLAAAATRVSLRRDIDGPRVVDVLRRHRHHTGPAIDVDASEEHKAGTGREIVAVPCA